MKRLLKNTVSLLTLLLWRLKGKNSTVKNSVLFLCTLQIEKSNDLELINASVEKSRLQIQGKNNRLSISGEAHQTSIQIWGDNNQVILSPKVRLNASTIIVRGSNCKIEIGEGSTFGSIYMVCMGQNNFIKIGKECMFATGIELWATDSHPIYHQDNVLINPSKPISIGNHVWIGAKSTVLKGVQIEEGAIIGMSSVVTKNVTAFSLNVGNPLRCVKTNIRWDRAFTKC